MRLPFTDENKPALGESSVHALQNFRRLELRLSRHTELARAYQGFMQEYEDLGHMSVISNPSSDPTSEYYIPHHAVWRAHSATPQLRVVFNASAVTTSGTSLNDHLLCGPKLQANLASVILR